MKAFLQGMPRRVRHTIQAVCSDMYEGFVNAAKEVLGKQVKLVIDRFHVAKLYGEGLDSLRKQELKRLKQTLPEDEYGDLKGAMWALRKKDEKLTEEEQYVLGALFTYSPDLRLAYELCNDLTALFDSQVCKRAGKRQLRHWMQRVRASHLRCFESFLTTLETWLDEIANYFVDRHTSGFVEGFNNKLKVIKRRCYGILNLTHLFQRIQLDLSGYTRFAHDPANRVLTTTFPPPASFPSGNRTVSLTYDAAGQLLTATAPDTGVVVHTYDTSLLATSTWTGTIAGSVERTYDALDRLATQSVNGGQSVPFTYDDGGFLTGAGALTLGRTPQGGLLSNTALGVVGDTSTYDGNEKVLTYQATAGVTVLLDQQYTRDEFGRVSQKIERLDGTTTTFAYTYDATGQLKQVTQDGSLVTTYTYDPNGNREQQDRPGGVVTGVYDAQDRLLSWGNATYAYTANGELSSKTVGSQTTAYDYDVLGNLLAVTLPDTTQIDYIVDGENRRIGKSINGMLVQGFLYQDALNPVAELDGSGNVVARFVYGSKEQVPDYMEKGGVIYRLISDQLGSVRLVVDTTTGGIVQRIDYDEFGQILVDTNPDFQPFGFAGGLYDQDTKLTRFGARDYDAEVGKWTAKDPIRFEGKDTNLYGYVFNDPVNLIDPEGQTFIIGVDAPSALIGALFGSTSTVAYNIAYSLRTGCEIDYTQLAYDAVAAAGLGAVLGGHLHLKAIFLSPAALARIDRIAEALAALHVGGVLGFNLGVVRPGSECRSTEP